MWRDWRRLDDAGWGRAVGATRRGDELKELIKLTVPHWMMDVDFGGAVSRGSSTHRVASRLIEGLHSVCTYIHESPNVSRKEQETDVDHQDSLMTYKHVSAPTYEM